MVDKVEVAGLSAFTLARCNLGHKAPPRKIWQKNGFDYLRCPACGLMWVSPQLDDASVAEIYRVGFSGKMLSQPTPGNFLAYQPVLRRLRRYRQTGRLLDVGAFTGNFLLAARADGWSQPEGTEISEPALAYARQHHGLTMHEGDLLGLALEPGYDVITLFDVIEHVRDPLATLQRVYDLLRPGGLLYLDTPHFDSLPRLIYRERWQVFFPWHRMIFTARAMRQALTQAGFTHPRIETLGVLPWGAGDPWQGYLNKRDLPYQAPQVAEAVRSARWRDVLRPLWLGVKRAHRLPFVALSRLGIQVGSQLFAWAEKPIS